ncbi:inward rectifier K channel (IRK-C) family protein [Thraustotheca clavata]|uniref:Inward rectifier K channel (IRK-C) family protein n=1 Tax=Thraustotheca clavata TaxID=74557 RepID=A0A1V9ZZM3_9STRA|nr:inward rectifier K channel (IRK-C) family protein [Thraustotheca clavata]
MVRAMNVRNVGDILQCRFKLGAFLTDHNNVRLMKDLHLVQPEWTSINVPVTLVHVIDVNSPLFNMTNEAIREISFLTLCSGFDTTFCETVYARHVYFRHSIELDKAFQNAVMLYHDHVVVDSKKFDSLIYS